MKKRVLSLFMALALCLTLLPTAALAEGEDAGDGTTTDTENVAEVTVGETTTQYTDLNTAFEAASTANSATLKLLADVETAYAYTVLSGSHTLDLNGKTLTSTNTGDGFLYINGGTLTIQDSGNGAINSVNSTLRVSSGGELTVTGGSFTSQNTNALYVNGGSAKLSGGTFDSKGDTHSIWVMDSGKAADLLVSGYRYMKADDTAQKSSYSDGGENGVKGATTVCKIPEGEVTYIDADGNEQTQAGCTELTSAGFTGATYESTSWFAAKGNVEMDDVLSAHGTINLILCDGATVTAPRGVAFESNADQPATLNIYAQSAGTGKLVANGVADKADMTAGIRNASSSSGEMTLNIYGGTVKATGAKCDVNPGNSSYSGAGIGTCVNDTSTHTLNVNIYGGTVIAQSGGTGGAAIGNGQGSTATVNVTIAGGMKCVKTDTPTEKAEYSNTDGVSVTITECVDHQWRYTDNKSDTHTKTCALCGMEGDTAAHSFDKFISKDANGHTYACVCGKESTEAHTLSYVVTNTTHKQACGLCGYETAESAHSFDAETGKCVCGADADIAAEKVKVTITTNGGTPTTNTYTDLLKAFKDADVPNATVEVTLLQCGKTYTLESTEAYPINFQCASNAKVIVNLNDCTLQRTVTERGHGILKVVKGNVTFQNGTLDFTVSTSNNPKAINMPDDASATLTLEDMTINVTGTTYEDPFGGSAKTYAGIAIYAGAGALNITGGIYGEVQIHSAAVKLSGGSYTEVEHMFGNYAGLLETGYIFAKQNDNSYIDPSDMSCEVGKDQNTKNIQVIPCTHKDASGASLFESGKCKQCGLTCTKHTLDSGHCGNCGREIVANDGSNYYYVSLNEAFANVANNSEILVTADLPEETLTFNCADKDVTLELYNRPVNGSADDAATLTVEGGKLTVINGIPESTVANDPAVITNSGKGFAVSVTGGTLAFGGKATLTGGLQVIKGGKLEGGLKEGSILIAGTGNAMEGGSASSVSVRDSVNNQNYGVVLDLLGEGLAFAKYNKDTGKTGEIIRGNEVALTEDVIVVECNHSEVTSLFENGVCKGCGYVCPHEKRTGNYCDVCGAPMVAKVGDSYYSTLAAAIEAAKDNGVVELVDFGDWWVLKESITVKAGTNVTININSVYWDSGDVASPLLTVDGGSVTLNGSGYLRLVTDSTADSIVLVKDGSLKLGEAMEFGYYSPCVPAIDVRGGTLTLGTDTRLYNGIKTSVAGATLASYLPNGTAFEGNNLDSTGGFITNGYVQELTKPDGKFLLIVVSHTHSTVLDENGKYVCACGYTCTAHEFVNGVCKNCGYACPHENVTETGQEGHKTASCGDCKAQMAVKVTSGDTTTYYAQMHYTYNGVDYDNTLKTILNGADGKSTGYALDGSTITLLTDGLNANAVVNNSRSITLDLNGKKLIETDGIRVEVGSKLTVTGEGSSSEDDNSRWPCVFNVQGGTLEFKALDFGGTFNAIRVGSGTLTSAREGLDAIKIGTLEIGSADAKVSFKAGAFDKIATQSPNVSVKLGDLLGMWKDAKGNDVRSGNAFQNEGGTFLQYDTEITNGNPIKNVKLATCNHNSLGAENICDYCLTKHLVAIYITDSGTVGNMTPATEWTEDAINTAANTAFNTWNSMGGTLRLFTGFALADRTITNPYANVIDLNGHKITGGTLTLDKNNSGKGANVTITDSSANKDGQFTNVTVNGGATLTVEGVSVGEITAAAADAKITLKAGTKFTGYKLHDDMYLAQWIEDGCCVATDYGNAVSLTMPGEDEDIDNGHFTVCRVPATFTKSVTSGTIRYNGEIPAEVFPWITADDVSSVNVTWWYPTDAGASSLTSNQGTVYLDGSRTNYYGKVFFGVYRKFNIGDKLSDAYCVLTAKDSSNKALWITVLRGYEFTLAAGDLSEAVVTVSNADSLVFTPDSNGVGQTRTLNFTVEHNGSMLELGTDYEIGNNSNTATNAGEHTLVLNGLGKYAGSTLEYKWTVKPRMLGGINELTKTYDGTTALPKTITFSDFNTAADITLTEGTDYAVTGQYDSAAAGKRTADLTVTLTNNNYTFWDGMTATIKAQNSASISEAPAPQVTERGSITIYYDRSDAAYTFDLNDLLPALDGGKRYGELKDASVSGTLPSDYSFPCNLDQSLKLNLNVSKVPSSGEDKELGTFTFTLKFENYEDIVLYVDVNAANRLTPTGAPTLSANEITYGDAVSSISLSGALKYDDKDVTGTFAWTDGTIKPNAGSYEAEWTFAPNDTIYAEVTGKTPITVKPAALTDVSVAQTGELTYNGAEQTAAVETNATAVNGQNVTFTYSAEANSSAYVSTMPKFKTAGTHTVYYKASADNHETATGSFKVTIKPKNVTVTVIAVNRSYDGSNAVELTAGNVIGAVSNDDVTVDVQEAVGTMADANVGINKAVTVTGVKLGGTAVGNYRLIAQPTGVIVTISAAASTVSAAPTAKTLTYNGSAQELVTTGTTADGTMVYSLSENGDYSADIPTGTKAGKYTVWYKVVGDGNHNDGAPESVEVTIAKAQVTVTARDKTAYVGSTAPDLTKPELDKDYTVSGLIGDDQLTAAPKLTYDPATPDMTKTGEAAKITASGASAGDNYDITYVAGKLTVTTRPSSGGSSSGSTTYTITVDKTKNGDVTVSPKSAAKGDTVTITVTPDKGYMLETITVTDKDGKEIKLTEKDGKYTFTMPSGKVTVKATFMDDNTMLNFFVDVKADDYFYDAVKWAAEKGITSGTDATHFSPNAACTRAQIVTFLWRAAGSPEPKNMSSFTDVPADSYYAKAVAWAAENGITGGTGDGQFSPDSTCTREQAVAFLYRASGSPAVSGGSAFSDVAAAAYYADAVAWAEQNGVTGGIGGGLFGTGSDCTRAQIVTFLYRTYQGK